MRTISRHQRNQRVAAIERVIRARAGAVRLCRDHRLRETLDISVETLIRSLRIRSKLMRRYAT